ncbi:MAG: tRNA uridine-5-carboxymethylaminomethyl(34) synthesis GTPase MnmE [Bacteroidota bacterium]|nr:tRNA uridine-5-carboxymethylaminomethyl(34) synthesis GTPase MnmE [Bacteroidota bacterium]
MVRSEETICAPATARGGAISVIRVSGKRSFDICEKIFFPTDKNLKFREITGYRLIHGEIRSGSELIDEVIVSKFRSPHSYTGENSVEISCHASTYIVSRILEALIAEGAVAAAPGEFTRRAFINGKMDLSQAEAVADLVASGTRFTHRIALNQMRGGFSAEIRALREELLKFASLIELELDFGEEDLEFADRKELMSIVVRVKEMADRMADSFRIGNAIKNGIPVAIAGKPNSGKSTLLNALLNEERAIVSELPGTTRDVIEDTIVINGIEYRFIDTAGLRETSDLIETLGIQKTKEKILQAAVVLMVDDIADRPEDVNERASVLREMISGSDRKLVILINKIDLALETDIENFKRNIILENNESLLFISAKNHTGLDELRERLSLFAGLDRIENEDVIVTNVRYSNALKQVSESLGRVIDNLENQLPEDLIAMDIRQAIHYLGEITGEITSDEILGNIFKNFCIGK